MQVRCYYLDMDAKDKTSPNATFIKINLTFLLLYVLVFQANFNNVYVILSLFLSFIFYLVSLGLHGWYAYRYPIRKTKLDESQDKDVGSKAHTIASFVAQIVLPMERLRKTATKEYLEAVNMSQEQLNSIRKGTKALSPDESVINSEAVDLVLDNVLENLANNAKVGYDVAFRKPLDEKKAKIKYAIDIISFSSRTYIFFLATGLLAFAICMQFALYILKMQS